MNAFLRLCDYLFVLRPLILLPAWSFFLLGAAQGMSNLSIDRGPFPSPVSFASLTGILVCAYLLNQIFDRDSDSRNGKCLYLARGIFSARTMTMMAVVFFVIASLAYQRTPAIHRAPLVVALVLALLYSLPPVRLCARPFVDMLANAVGYGGVAFYLGYTVFGTERDGLLLAVPYVLLVGATFVHTAMMDMEGDAQVAKITTAVKLGERASAWFAFALHTAGLVSAIALHNPLALAIVGITLPVALFAAYGTSTGRSSMLVQTNTLAITVAAIVWWPWYAAVVGGLLILSRFYYRRRFGVTYPGPQGSA